MILGGILDAPYYLMPRKLSLILEDEFIEVDEIFEGGTLHGVDEKVGSDVDKNNERHSPEKKENQNWLYMENMTPKRLYMENMTPKWVR